MCMWIFCWDVNDVPHEWTPVRLCWMCIDILWYRCSIPHFIGLSRTDLKGKAVVLYDDNGHALCEGLICNTKPMDWVDNNILGLMMLEFLSWTQLIMLFRDIGRILCTAGHFFLRNLKDIHWQKICWPIIMRPAKFKAIGGCLENASTTMWGCVHLGHLERKF